MARVPSAPISRSSLDTGEPGSRFRSVSAVQSSGNRLSRSPGREEGAASDDDYDYISAYTGAEGKPGEGGASGYEHGRFATNLEQDGGVGLR